MIALFLRTRLFIGLILICSLFVLALTLGMNSFLHTSTVYATGASYYVNCSASSNGTGSQQNPWNTLSVINSKTFNPGDSILFQRGTTCSGELNPQGSGNSSASITINDYGTGALPIINGGTNAATLKLSDQQYWEINNLEIIGGNPRGVYITGQTANITLHHFRLTNLLVHNVGGTTTARNDTGLVVLEPQGNQETLDDVVVNGVTTNNTQESEGIFVGAGGFQYPGQRLDTKVVIENSTAHDVYGDGILLTETQQGLLQNNVVYHSGLCKSNCGSTPNGLWEWYCQNCTVQNNESYANSSWSGGDGGDFDIDYYNTANTVQYNYGHDSQGYCVGIFGAGGATNTNSIFRDNVCSNNQRGNAQGDVFLTTWNGGSLNGVQIYNNTFYWNPATNQALLMNSNASFVGANANFFKNNLIYSTVPDMIDTPNTLSLDNNLYWTTSSSNPTWTYNGASYTSFSTYQAGSNQDTHTQYANPLLKNPTSDATGRPTTAFTLQAGSPAIGSGTMIANNGGRDFYGNAVSSTTNPNIGAYNGKGSGNLLLNPGFESGSLSPWLQWNNVAVVGSNTHSGVYALRDGAVPCSGDQIISGLQPDTSYTLSGWGKVVNGGEYIMIGVKNYGGQQRTVSINSTSYTQGTVTFTTGSTNTTADIFFYKPDGTGYGYGDDFALVAN